MVDSNQISFKVRLAKKMIILMKNHQNMKLVKDHQLRNLAKVVIKIKAR